jgi:hypothetical protein
MIKKIVSVFMVNIFLFVWLFSFVITSICFWEDLMEKAFSAAKNQWAVVNLWNNKAQVGSEVVGGWTTITIGWDKLIDWDVKAPLIVKITKFLLRMTIVLSITMVIYNGIQYILQSTSGWDTKWATKNLWLVAGGIVLALLSLAIIQIIQSLTLSSLDF